MSSFFWEIWGNPLFRLVLGFIALGVLMLVSQILWLTFRSLRRGATARIRRRFDRGPGVKFFEGLFSQEGVEAWIQAAGRYPRQVVRGFLLPRMLLTAGDVQDRIRLVYNRMGFLKQDVRMLRSFLRNRRMVALRRLLLAATPTEAVHLRRFASGDHVVRTLATIILGRVGGVDDLYPMLRALELPRRTMEQPLYSVLEALDAEILEALVDRWRDYRDPRVRKILLVVAARRVPGATWHILPFAAQDDSYDVRAGAAMACGARASIQGLGILRHLLEDPDPVVRAQAAVATRRYSALFEPGDLDLLARCMKDAFFWVRQNAAMSLAQWGEAGRLTLERIARESQDPYCRDTARQELQRIRLWVTQPVSTV